jgi:hypothetical protein
MTLRSLMRYIQMTLGFLFVLLIAQASHGSDPSGLWSLQLQGQWQIGETAPPESGELYIFQNGSLLSGYGTLDASEPWEAVLKGRGMGKSFDLILTVYQRPLVMIELFGEMTSDTKLQGSFVGATSRGSAWQGSFVGSLITSNPVFLPSETSQAEPEPKADEVKEAAVQSPSSQVQGKSRFYDIRYTRDTVYPRPVL